MSRKTGGAPVGVLTDKVIKDLRELTPQFLMPLDEIKSFRWLKDPDFLTIAGIGLFPLLCMHLFSDLKSAYWALALYFSTLWAVFLSQRFPSPQVTRGRTLVCFFGTGLVSIAALLLLHEILPFRWFWHNTLGKGYLLTFFGMFFGVAIWEEACKLAMVVLMLRTSPERLSLQTMLFYGLMSGLGFGIYEGVSYQTGQNWFLLSDSPGNYYLANVIRLTSLPFLHAVWTGMAAYFLALSTMYPSRKHGLMVAAILIPALLHTSHNTFDGMFEFAADFISVLALLVYQRQSAAFETACVPLREDPPNVQAPAVAGAK